MREEGDTPGTCSECDGQVGYFDDRRRAAGVPGRREPGASRRHRDRAVRGAAAEVMATLRTERLTKAYGGRTVVRDVELDVASGEVVGLLGPNGAGQDDDVRHGRRADGPDAGRVLLDDQDVTGDPMYVRARKGIGYLPQEPSIFRGLTVEENVLAILETLPIDAAERRERLEELLAELGLTPLARSRAYTLSGGERRRVEITRALVNRPKFILLDEPFAGIDPIAVAEIQKIVGTSQGPGHRRAGHGPQRARDAEDHRSGLHRARRRDLPERDAGEPGGRQDVRARSEADLARGDPNSRGWTKMVR